MVRGLEPSDLIMTQVQFVREKGLLRKFKATHNLALPDKGHPEKSLLPGNGNKGKDHGSSRW